MGNLLPEGYESLEPFVAEWAVEGSQNRTEKRSNSTEAGRQAFYDATKDLIAPGLAFLDAKPLAEHDEKETRLMALFLTFAHVALAVEVQGADEDKHAALRAFMPITRAPADVPA